MPEFERGNPGGPGGARPGSGPKPNPVKVVSTRLIEWIEYDDMQAIVGKAIEQAKAGDSGARNWLFDRVFGKSPQPFHLDELTSLRREVERLHSMAPMGRIDGLSDWHYQRIVNYAQKQVQDREKRERQIEALLEQPEPDQPPVEHPVE